MEYKSTPTDGSSRRTRLAERQLRRLR